MQIEPKKLEVKSVSESKYIFREETPETSVTGFAQ